MLHIYCLEGDIMILKSIINKYENYVIGIRKHSFIQIYDNKKMLIEICRNIVEFNENMIKLELAESDMVLMGFNLKFRNYNKNGIEVSGDIHSINFEEKRCRND